MARSMLSFGIDWALAFWIASRRRGFIVGSGTPHLAATVISRASLENIFDRTASWRPLRCMMFLNCEWPAMTSLSSKFGDFRNGGLIDKLPSNVQKERHCRLSDIARLNCRRCSRRFDLPGRQFGW